MAEEFVSQRSGELEDVARSIFERGQKPTGRLDQDGYRASAPPVEKPEEAPTEESEPVEETEEQPEEEPTEETEEQPEEELAEEGQDFVEVQVEGEAKKVPVTELVKGYMLQSDYTKKTQQLAQERQKWEGERALSVQAEQEAVGIVSNLAQQLQMELQRSMPTPEQMAQLREQDPGEWSARMAEHGRRAALVAEAQRQARISEQRQIQQRVPVEKASLLKAMPEDFSDFPKVYTELSAWIIEPIEAGGGGLQPDEWGQIVDHRLVRLAQLAHMEAKRRKAGAKATREAVPRIKKAVSELPRVRAGAPIAPKTAAERRLADANRALQRNPNSTDALADVLLARQTRGRGAPSR